MKKIIALLSGLILIAILNMSVAQEINVTPEDIKKWEADCTLDNGSGCGNLGNQYNTGQGVTQDYFKAVEYYTKACNLDVGQSCFNLGVLYANGQGVRLDKQKAKEFFGKACDLKHQIGCDGYKLMSE